MKDITTETRFVKFEYFEEDTSGKQHLITRDLPFTIRFYDTGKTITINNHYEKNKSR